MMLRYRIAKDPQGRYFVLPALAGIVPLEQTYASRVAAGQTADWCNRLRERNGLPRTRHRARYDEPGGRRPGFPEEVIVACGRADR